MYTGKIYIADHEGMPVGLGQPVAIVESDEGYAAHLVTEDGNIRVADFYETEAAALTALKSSCSTGGVVITVIIDDL